MKFKLKQKITVKEIGPYIHIPRIHKTEIYKVDKQHFYVKDDSGYPLKFSKTTLEFIKPSVYYYTDWIPLFNVEKKEPKNLALFFENTADKIKNSDREKLVSNVIFFMLSFLALFYIRSILEELINPTFTSKILDLFFAFSLTIIFISNSRPIKKK